MCSSDRAYGVVAVTEGLERYERFLSGADRPRIGNAGAYLRTIIANKAREEAPAGQGAGPERTALVVVENKTAPAVPASRRDVEDAERHRRFSLIRDQFAKLDQEEQLEWVRRVRDEADASTAPSPSIMKRLARGEWQSPLVQVMVIQHYARSELGEDWATLPLAEFENLMSIDAGSERDVG